MTPEEQLELVRQHYALNGAGDHAAARELLTDDFSITIPPHLPFAGVYRGKDAFAELIPMVVKTVAVAGVKLVATTVGEGCAVEIVEWTLADDANSTVRGAELIWFRGNQICEMQPFYFDPSPMIRAGVQPRAAEPGRPTMEGHQ